MWLVALAACGSAFWILTANAWMRNPVGYEIRNGRAELVDLWAVVLNPTAIYSIIHTISASIALSAFFVMGICAYHLKGRRETEFFGRSLRIALVAGTVSTLILVGRAISWAAMSRNVSLPSWRPWNPTGRPRPAPP
jgi:cytochrome d ubiquinol oxidase subunit I